MHFARQLKYLNLMRGWWMNAMSHTALFVRIIPTDRCNLSCKYCFQSSEDPREMTREEFEACLEKAKKLRVGLLSFLGGEPLTWTPLHDAIASCTRRHVLTDVTTNGTLLTAETIDRLGAAGLDFLNISVDVSRATKVTPKNSILRPRVLEPLLAARRRYGMQVRVNSVLYKDNTSAIKDLVEYTHQHDLPISVGFIVPHFDGNDSVDDSIYFTLDDRDLLDDITRFLIAKKTSGYKIIDTRECFRNVYRFLRGEKFWDCNYQRRFGWLNVTPSGRIRTCTKKMDELEDRFVDLTPRRIKELMVLFREKIVSCNTSC